jgi:hypothetical protein
VAIVLHARVTDCLIQQIPTTHNHSYAVYRSPSYSAIEPRCFHRHHHLHRTNDPDTTMPSESNKPQTLKTFSGQADNQQTLKLYTRRPVYISTKLTIPIDVTLPPCLSIFLTIMYVRCRSLVLLSHLSVRVLSMSSPDISYLLLLGPPPFVKFQGI